MPPRSPCPRAHVLLAVAVACCPAAAKAQQGDDAGPVANAVASPPSSGPAGRVASTATTNVPPGLIAIPAGAGGASATPMGPQLMRRLGSFERAAAGMADLLATYRAMLVDVVPALHAVVAAGQRAGARPATPLPPAAQQVFVAWAERLAAQPRAAGVPSLGWAHHGTIADLLSELGASTRLGALMAPTQALHVALGHQVNLTADTLAGLGSQRAVGVYNVDDALVAAEVQRTGRALASLAENAASGHALDALELVLQDAQDARAFSEASAQSTAQQLGSSYLPLLQLQRSVGGHLADFTRVIAAMATPPPPAAADLRVQLRDRGDDVVQAELHWTPPRGPHGGASVLRVVRRIDVPAARRIVDDAAACGALAADAAANALSDLLAHDAPEVVVELTGESSSFNESVPLQRRDWPHLYKVVASSAFGVEAHAHEVAAQPAFAALQPARHVRACALAPRYDDANFYRLADAVAIHWQPSASEAAGPGELTWASDRALAVAYDIYRVTAQGLTAGADEPALAPLVAAPPPTAAPLLAQTLPAGWQRVATVKAGTSAWLDRPSLQALAAGVAYVVVARDGQGAEARLPGACGQSNVVRTDVRPAWRLARLGAARLPRPTAHERAHATWLASSEGLQDLAAAQAQFAAQPEAAQLAAWQAFWARLPEAERVALQRIWPEQLGELQARAARESGYQRLCTALRDWAHVCSCAAADLALRRSVADHWQMLAPAERQEALAHYRRALGPRFTMATSPGGDRPEHGGDGNGLPSDGQEEPGSAFGLGLGPDDAPLPARAATQPTPQPTPMASAASVAADTANAGVRAEAAAGEAVQLWSWWRARDDEEKRQIEQWWQEQPPEQREQRLQAFWQQLTEAQRDAATWPEPALLNAQERRDWMEHAPWPVPQRLVAPFFAFLHDDAMAAPDREAAVAAEVGPLGRTLEKVRYLLRPVDAWLDFKLSLLMALLVTAALMGLLSQHAARAPRHGP